MHSPTGLQFELSSPTPLGEARAIITEVAASLRTLSIGGVHLTEPYGDDVVPPFGDGTVLVPWPNRVEDGLWRLDGIEQQLDLTEPERGNALHGLLRDRPYTVADRSASAVTLAATVFPTRGYPFQLDTTVRYELVDDGLRVTHGITNVGSRSAPVAVGTHPFLRLGDVPTDELVLTVAAGSRFETDARLNPVSENPVEGTDFDLRAGRPVAELHLDDAFGAVTPAGALSRHRLTASDGRFVELWQEGDFAFVQVFATRIFPRDVGLGTPVLGTAIAVEPMTAPPNAFNSGQGLRWLAPGETWSLSWGIRYSGKHEGE
ncbi:aldose 1-epimerase family protein [Lacisediminihabitans profunda]|uniref:Aldose 1-epimerase family protein n=1 Tax=Lacisediminihabitans profunda TaxID=2594790 RepID=A0A5C8UY56_9MICO|nr:aldose 1-epimerase family protein [Lacisediminihabitans profunda]TXN32639.1 aldose 1-epimerase family protein [Lacisediminihabitans profunda]